MVPAAARRQTVISSGHFQVGDERVRAAGPRRADSRVRTARPCPAGDRLGQAQADIVLGHRRTSARGGGAEDVGAKAPTDPHRAGTEPALFEHRGPAGGQQYRYRVPDGLDAEGEAAASSPVGNGRRLKHGEYDGRRSSGRQSGRPTGRAAGSGDVRAPRSRHQCGGEPRHRGPHGGRRPCGGGGRQRLRHPVADWTERARSSPPTRPVRWLWRSVSRSRAPGIPCCCAKACRSSVGLTPVTSG